MGLDGRPNYKAEEDGNTYCYIREKKCWVKVVVSDLASPKELPPSVRAQVREKQNEAELILSIPLD